MWGRFASRRGESRYPALWDGRVAAWCPSVTGPTGTRLYDLQSQRYQGTLTNMDPPTDWVRSSGQYALDFDGVNDYVTMPAIVPARGFSLSIWFRAATTAKTRQSLFANSLDASPDIYLHLERVSGAVYAMNFYNGGGYLGASSSFTLDLNWHHYAWVTTASGAVLYYYDGIGVGTAAGTWTPGNDNSTATIGAIVGLLSDFATQGQIDDVARYSRSLTAGEIRTLSRRRGIAYEARRQDFGSSGFQAAWARQRAQLIGGGLR